MAAVRALLRLRPRKAIEMNDGWLHGQRGAIATEYAVVVAACAILISAALAALGAPLLASYESSRHTLIAPEP